MNSLFGCAVRLQQRTYRQKNFLIIYQSARTITNALKSKSLSITNQQQFCFEFDSNELKENIRKSYSIGIADVFKFDKNDGAVPVPRFDELHTKDEVMGCINYIVYVSKIGRSPTQFIKQKSLQQFLVQMQPHIEYMSADELIISIIALHLANVPLHHPAAQDITIGIARKLKGK